MCGRYALHGNREVIALQFGLEPIAEFQASYNICPSALVLIVRPGASGRCVADRYRWGLGNKLANARGETVAEKPAFRDAFRRWRCLVPASGFYEWQSVAGRKQPWYVRPRDTGLFGLAGITTQWNGRDGPVRAVAIVTTGPNELMRPIHDRMPVIIEPGDYAAWINARNEDPKALLRPYPDSRMEAYPVSLRVNTPKYDDAALIEPV